VNSNVWFLGTRLWLIRKRRHVKRLSVCLKMPKSPDVMMSTEVYQQQYDLRIKPMAVGVKHTFLTFCFVSVTLCSHVLNFLCLV